ncbi:hypothetical protein OIU76_000687 [Salix suchowensis]|nr:hypothetical protein OIU76_000687 [Salix suchowensis]
MKQHLVCAALEHPLSLLPAEKYFGSSLSNGLMTLKNKGDLSLDPSLDSSSTIWSYIIGHEKMPSRGISIRAIESIRHGVIDMQWNEVLEEIEKSKAFFQIYEGAVCMHQGKTYMVKELDISEKIALCYEANLPIHQGPSRASLQEQQLKNFLARAFYGFQMKIENINSDRALQVKKQSKHRVGSRVPCFLQRDLLLLLVLKESFSREDCCRVHWQKVYHIVGAAVGIETKFVCEALPCALIGMNTMLVGEYIKFVADHLLVGLGNQKKYRVENPFKWMEFISLH